MKDKKKHLSNVSNMVKTFLKKKSSSKKLSFHEEGGKCEKTVSRKLVGMKTTETGSIKAKSITAKPVTVSQEAVKQKTNRNDVRAIGKRRQNTVATHLPPGQKNETSRPRYFFISDIPDSYNETYLRAIPRDPEWLFAFWELSGHTKEELRGKMGDGAFASAKRILRIIDISNINYDGSNAQFYKDMEINEVANSWYVQVPESGKTYLLEIGFLTTSGRFYLATRSNALSIPRKGVSPIQDEKWATLDELIHVSAEAIRMTGLGASERRFVRAEALVGHTEVSSSLGSGSGGLGDSSSISRC